MAQAIYGVTEQGNFEERNILHLEKPIKAYAEAHHLAPSNLQQRLNAINSALLAVRVKRNPPLLDDKIITSWNAMMISTLVLAADTLDNPAYGKAAKQAAEFLWSRNRQSEGRLWRIHRNGSLSIPGTVEDYTFLAKALLDLYDLDADSIWLERATELAGAMSARFLDRESRSVFVAEADSGITSMGRLRDNAVDTAIPTSTAIVVEVFQRLGHRTGGREWPQSADMLSN